MKPVYIDAAPIMAELAKRADQPKGKNPYENIKISTYRKSLELLLNAPVVDIADFLTITQAVTYKDLAAKVRDLSREVATKQKGVDHNATT